MALTSGLQLWCYTSDGTVVQHYSRRVASLSFSTNAPGGWGDLSCQIHLTRPDIPRPELQLFSRVALMGHGENGPYAVFEGEIMQSQLVRSGNAASLSLSALGLGNCLRDDPVDSSYSANTPLQIITDQLTSATLKRNKTLVLDQDTSAILNTSATTYTVPYTKRTFEEVLHDILTLDGDYHWGVWSHPKNRDVAGFPTGQLQVHTRDTATTHYTAGFLSREIASATVAQSADQAYNVVRVGYNDPVAGTLGTSFYVDPRLAADGGQGTAPFRWRATTKSYEGLSTLTSAQATTLATTFGGLWKNVGNRVQISLDGIRNAYGLAIPLWTVRADQNIFVPELAVRGAQLATSAVAGTNQFYILGTHYREDGKGARLELTCDNYFDTTQSLLARLQSLQDALSRTVRVAGSSGVATGAQVKGWYEVLGIATAGAQTFAAGVTYPNAPLSGAPTSITLSTNFSVNRTNLRTANKGTYGFTVLIDSVGAGSTEDNGTYLTNGNCIYDVDAARGTFTHHCQGTFWLDRRAQIGRVCDTTRRGLVIGRDTCTTRRVYADGQVREELWVECPICGSAEGLNLAMGAADEAHSDAHRAQQSRNIRALMRHAAVGLHHLVRDCDCGAQDCPAAKRGAKRGKEASGHGGPTGGGGARRRRADVSRGGGGGADGAGEGDTGAA